MSLWLDSSIQFPRLIAEINATVELTKHQKEELCESMSIDSDELDELFERANNVWELEKATLSNLKLVFINCPKCSGGTLKIIEANEYGLTTTKCQECLATVVIDKGGNIETR